MSLLDSVKNTYIDQKQKIDDRKEQRGKKIAHIKVDYVGGYDDKKRKGNTLDFYEHRIEYSVPLTNKSIITNSSDIAKVAIEGKDEVNSRVTFTRILAIGIFALAKPKKKAVKEAFITIVMKDGREVIFHNKELSPTETRGKLINALSLYSQARVSQTGETLSTSKSTSS